MAIESTDKGLIISIPYQLHFVSKRDSEGWTSGCKTLRGFMQKHNIMLEGDQDINGDLETESIQTANVRQHLSMQNVEPIKDLFQSSLESEVTKVIGGANKFEKEFLKYNLIHLEIMRQTKDCNSYYIFDVPGFNYVAIQKETDYEWTLGTVNLRYLGPYALEAKAYNRINELLKHPPKCIFLR